MNLFSDYLQKFGYETIPFNNPVDALNHLNTSNNSNCSLVISDYKMPQMSGIDLIKKIREKDSTFKLKIILISAFIKSDILNNDISNSLRIDKIIEKPVHLENLKEEDTETFVNLINNLVSNSGIISKRDNNSHKLKLLLLFIIFYL